MATVINAPIKSHGTVTYPKLRVVLDSLQFTLDSLITTGLTANSFALTDSSGAIATSANFTYSSSTFLIGSSGHRGSLKLYYDAESRYLELSTATAVSKGFVASAPRWTIASSSTGIYLEAQTLDNLTSGVILSDSGSNQWLMEFQRSSGSALSFHYNSTEIISASTTGTITIPVTSNQFILGATRTVTLTAPTPASTSRVVTIPDLTGDYSVVGTIGTQTIAGSKTFSSAINITATSNHLVLSTSSNTLTLQANTQATSARTWSIPDITGNGTFAALEGTQTFSGSKTFSSAVNITATSNHLVLSTSSNTLTLQANAQATSARTWSVPDITGNGTFAALEGTQTFSGSKTFSSQIISTATSNHLKLATATSNAIISVATIATADRTITIPDPGTNANFVLSEATATINGVKTFGNDTIHTGDVYTDAYQDWTTSSTIVGWSSFTTKFVLYKKVGKLVFVKFFLTGPSNSATTTFTVPYTSTTDVNTRVLVFAVDNGAAGVAGRVDLPSNSSTVTAAKDPAGSAFLNSGTKSVAGEFWYATAT